MYCTDLNSRRILSPCYREQWISMSACFVCISYTLSLSFYLSNKNKSHSKFLYIIHRCLVSRHIYSVNRNEKTKFVRYVPECREYQYQNIVALFALLLYFSCFTSSYMSIFCIFKMDWSWFTSRNIKLTNSISTQSVFLLFRTPLHLAVFHGHEEIVRMLLEQNCDVNARDMVRVFEIKIRFY